MQIRVRCVCGHLWYVAPDLAGGLTNCPRCGKATQVDGLKDPLWRVLQGAAVVGWVVVVTLLYAQTGPLGAVLGGVALAAILGLIYLMM